jgi:hypothetical protein
MILALRGEVAELRARISAPQHQPQELPNPMSQNTTSPPGPPPAGPPPGREPASSAPPEWWRPRIQILPPVAGCGS